MKKKRIDAYRPVYPSPAALISAAGRDGRTNIITLGEVFNISIRSPVIVGIAIRPATYTHSLISDSGEFVVNLPTAALVAKVDACGSVSGRSGLDKFKAFGLTPAPADEVAAPLVAECPVNIECKVVGRQTIGDHDLFLGEVLAVHADEDKLDAEDALVAERLDMLVYVTGSYWSSGKRLESMGFSRKKAR